MKVSGSVARSRTPPAPRKASNLQKKRPRAVSDFGAVGDALPELNSEDLLANLRSDAKFGYTNLKSVSHFLLEESLVW